MHGIFIFVQNISFCIGFEPKLITVKSWVRKEGIFAIKNCNRVDLAIIAKYFKPQNAVEAFHFQVSNLSLLKEPSLDFEQTRHTAVTFSKLFEIQRFISSGGCKQEDKCSMKEPQR